MDEEASRGMASFPPKKGKAECRVGRFFLGLACHARIHKGLLTPTRMHCADYVPKQTATSEEGLDAAIKTTITPVKQADTSFLRVSNLLANYLARRVSMRCGGMIQQEEDRGFYHK